MSKECLSRSFLFLPKISYPSIINMKINTRFGKVFEDKNLIVYVWIISPYPPKECYYPVLIQIVFMGTCKSFKGCNRKSTKSAICLPAEIHSQSLHQITLETILAQSVSNSPNLDTEFVEGARQ